MRNCSTLEGRLPRKLIALERLRAAWTISLHLLASSGTVLGGNNFLPGLTNASAETGEIGDLWGYTPRRTLEKRDSGGSLGSGVWYHELCVVFKNTNESVAKVNPISRLFSEKFVRRNVLSERSQPPGRIPV